MLYVFPDYYKSFECIAGRCRHSCCIGWEIDIDEKTLNKYSALNGKIAKSLADNISLKGTPHFILGADERCPFLNERGLCDLILFGGEDVLCNICSDHPRFRNFLPGRTETGIGLCCEEAARIIIDHPKPAKLVYAGFSDEQDDYTDALISLRDELLYISATSDFSYSDRVSEVLARCRINFPARSPKDWAELLLSLERMDKVWTNQLEELIDADISKFDYVRGNANLLSYFLCRHVAGAYEDSNIQGRVLFAVISVYVINLLCAVCGKDELYDIARLYSAEIECSEENLNTLFNL